MLFSPTTRPLVPAQPSPVPLACHKAAYGSTQRTNKLGQEIKQQGARGVWLQMDHLARLSAA